VDVGSRSTRACWENAMEPIFVPTKSVQLTTPIYLPDRLRLVEAYGTSDILVCVNSCATSRGVTR